MPIPTEQVGSVPRSPELLQAMREHAAGQLPDEQFRAAQDAALHDTISRLEATGSPVISDGEQTKPSFATYPVSGLQNLAPDGVGIPFADGHTRQLPKLTAGPFRYGLHASSFLKAAKKYAHRPVKQAVISASALSLLIHRMGFVTTLRKPSSATFRTKQNATSASACRPVPPACRSTSPKAGSH